MRDQVGYGDTVGVFFMAMLCALAAGWIVLQGFGDPFSPSMIHGFGLLIVYFIAWGGILALAISAVQKHLRGKALPFPRGRYLFPMDIVVARSAQLIIYSMSELTNFQGTHQHNNGTYTHTTLRFTFAGGRVEGFIVRSQAEAERVIRQLAQARERMQEAAQRQDMEVLAAMDPLLEPKLREWAPAPSDEGPTVALLHPVLRQPAVGLALAAAVALAPVSWGARDLASDAAALSEVRSQDRSRGYRAYLEHGGRSDEVRQTLLPASVLKEARETGTVTALRAFKQEFSGSPLIPEAQETIQAIYDDALERFHAQAAADSPEVVPFFTALLRWLAEHDAAEVAVRFQTPTDEVLSALDQDLATAGGRLDDIPVAAVAPHFSPEQSHGRESTITGLLQQGFSTVFPGDVLHLAHGARLGAAGLDLTQPALEVRYEVLPSGAMYTGEDEDRLYVGIVVSFDVTMRVPEHPLPLEFKLVVEPPDEFTVEESTLAFLGEVTPDISDSKVYAVMAARAFDLLASELRGTFFEEGSVAYQQSR